MIHQMTWAMQNRLSFSSPARPSESSAGGAGAPTSSTPGSLAELSRHAIIVPDTVILPLRDDGPAKP